MDLIERVFGISPDGGNGVTELTIVVTLALVVAAGGFALRRAIAAKLTSPRPSKPTK